MIVIRGLTAGYPGDPPVLQVDRLSFNAGTVSALVGANGSGKSTLLSVIAGLVTPRDGAALVFGARPRGRDIAVAFQSSPSDASLPLTVAEVVAMGRYPRLGLFRRFGAADRQAVALAMAQLEVTDLAERQLEDLSGGQRQRVLVARALAQRGRILLLDEPTTGLDRSSRDRILEAVAAEKARGTVVVMATHDLDDAALADRVVLLAGRVLADGAPSEVLTDALLGAAYARAPTLSRHGP